MTTTQKSPAHYATNDREIVFQTYIIEQPTYFEDTNLNYISEKIMIKLKPNLATTAQIEYFQSPNRSTLQSIIKERVFAFWRNEEDLYNIRVNSKTGKKFWRFMMLAMV